MSVLVEGLAYPEGPCFDDAGVLHFVELAGGCVGKVVNGEKVVVAEVPGSPNGAAFDHRGRLWWCNNGGNWGPNASTGHRPGLGGGPGLIQRLEADGSVTDVITATSGGQPLNSPNDLAFDAEGGLWFTDPVWARRDPTGSAPAAASPPGRLCYAGPDEVAVPVATGLSFPNGLALVPGERALIVGETGTGRLLRHEILGPGRLGPAEVWSELGDESFPDGLCFTASGRLVVAGTGSGTLFVVGPDGRLQERRPMDDIDVTNVCFGGPGHRSLYVTQAALGRIEVLEWPEPGARLPGR
ncbi:SMP-30/gluconolactonase/LRE family protein [Kineosporia succinea]|uniref:Gluconolactonase n=1 Tax=Kineosporia succinea TaxID=84632 RepID=A0ABT9PC21_9ACTN|nr:SMP-30/gluconolactonase/LRE family protein [Kineosporia succinea]MDP9830241.1 gluconolactonase [Kineosporia succinea]